MYNPLARTRPARAPTQKKPLDRLTQLREQMDNKPVAAPTGSGVASDAVGRALVGGDVGKAKEAVRSGMNQTQPAAPFVTAPAEAIAGGSSSGSTGAGNENIGNRDGAPGQPDPGAQNPANMSTDMMQEQFIRNLLKGGMNPDTSEMDALLHQLFSDQTGQQLVDQRASMGRAGFGASGALGAMEGDVMRKAAQGESKARIDFDTAEKQRAIDNALSSVGADIGLRGATRDQHRQDQDDQLLNMWIDIMNGNDTTDAGGDEKPKTLEEKIKAAQDAAAKKLHDRDSAKAGGLISGPSLAGLDPFNMGAPEPETEQERRARLARQNGVNLKASGAWA